MVGRDEALRRLRRAALGGDFEFATVLEVTDGGPDGFLVRVRSGQRLHPHTVVVAADEQGLAFDYGVGDPLPEDDVELWVGGVVTMLVERFDTGGLRWGQRVTLSDGTVAIDPMLETEPNGPWWISPVPLERPAPAGQRRLRRLIRGTDTDHVVLLGDGIPEEPDPSAGGHLRDVGLDVRPGRSAHADGRLIQWLQVYLDEHMGAPPVGQLVVAWHEQSETVGLLEYVECEPVVPDGAVEDLVLVGVHAAADAGAHVIEYEPHGERLHLHGRLPWQQEGGRLRLHAADVP